MSLVLCRSEPPCSPVMVCRKTALPVSGAKRRLQRPGLSRLVIYGVDVLQVQPKAQFSRNSATSERSSGGKGMLSCLFRSLSPHFPRIVVSLPERNRRSRARCSCTHECYQFPPRSRRKCEYTHVVFLNYSIAGPPQVDEGCERKSFVPCRPEK
jgi:hypothetical protein